MTNFTAILPGLTFVVVMFSLFMSLVGIMLAKRASKNQINTTEPWSLTNLKDDLWLLKRNTPVIATIHGIVVEQNEDFSDPENLKNLQSPNTKKREGSGFSFISSADEPSKYFRNGTTILIRVNPDNAGATFTLYYEEHKKESKSPVSVYQADLNLGGSDILPSKMQAWSTTLY